MTDHGRKENAAINSYEMRAGKTRLQSTPKYVTVGAHCGCNADCVFCLGGDYPRFDIGVYRELFEPRLADVFRRAEHVGFCGYGEVLLMPGIEAFLDHLDATLPDTQKVFTTNGMALVPAVRERLARGNYSVLVSLHAPNRALHERLVRRPWFDEVIARVRSLAAERDRAGSALHLNLIFLATTLNIAGLPDFVRLASEIGADRVSCSYLTVFKPEHLALSCFFAQERTNTAFDRSQELAAGLGVDLVLPPRFGRHGTGPQLCHDPWSFFYVETQGSVNPCCFAGDHIGHLDREGFDAIWNGPAYLRLREGLLSGRVHDWCRHCYRRDPDNVNDLRSHITFRPQTQREILAWLREHPEISAGPDAAEEERG